jgi:exosome complex component RRP42
VIDLAIMAARSALAVTRVPATRSIGYEKGEVEVGAEMQEQSGISGLVKGGKGGSKAVDFELIDGGWEEGERLEGWQDLPVGLTLNLVSSLFFLGVRRRRLIGTRDGQINQLPHLDATTVEETATSSQVVFCFTSKGDLCGLKQIGAGEIEFARLMPLLGVRTI